MGDGAVGKTALVERYISRVFQGDYKHTIGADCIIHETEVNGKEIKFQIWDLAGQPKYGSVRPIYYRGSVGGILVYDITRPETYLNTTKWLEEAFKNTGRGPVPVILIANKEDLRDEFPDALSRKHGLELAKSIDKITSNKGFTCLFLETSAKTGQNVEEAFRELGGKVLTYIESLTSNKTEQEVLTT
jgi:small GTP-binding protein